MNRLTLALLLISTMPALADDGLRAIDQPTTITQPGSYIVTRSFVGTGIAVEADGVILDLNGMTLEVLTVSYQPIRISPPPGGFVAGVTVRNGKLVGGQVGVSAWDGAAGPIRLENLEIEGPSSHGIWLRDTMDIAVVGCRFRNVPGTAILREYFSELDHAAARITGNRIEAPGESGIVLGRVRGAIVTDNVIESPGIDGISISGPGARVARNTVRGAAGTAPAAGIHLFNGDGGFVVDNAVAAGTGVGINIVGLVFRRPILVQRNVVTGHTGHGIEVSAAETLIERNQVTGNGGHGLYVSIGFDTVPYRNNMLRGNTAGSVGAVVAGVVDDQSGNVCDGACP